MNSINKPILGYGFRVFVKRLNNLNKLNVLVKEYNNKNKSNIIFNIDDKSNIYGQKKVFIGFDKLKNCYLNSIHTDQIITYNKNLNLFVTNNELTILSKLHKEVIDMGLILDENLSWNICNYN